MKFSIIIFSLFASGSLCATHASDKANFKEAFKTPGFEYRAIYPFRGAGGDNNKDAGTIKEQLDVIYDQYGFGGVIVSPTTDKRFSGQSTGVAPGYMQHVGSGLQAISPEGASPWIMTLPKGVEPYKYKAPEIDPSAPKPEPLPAYLSDKYFDQLKEILSYSKQKGRKVVFYDEVGYPSGIANHTTPEKYYRKLLEKSEESVTGPVKIAKQLPEEGVLMAVVAMNKASLERIDLGAMVKGNTLNWSVPAGDWKIMVFNCVTAKSYGTDVDYHVATDYMDTEAVSWFIDKVYEPHAREVGNYFGNTLFQTFFDDVGIFDQERTWTPKFNEKFKELTGVDPATYYPALWESIGTETEAARAAFFNTRAVLLADGFPKMVSQWGKTNGVDVSGHCPGNYDPQPVDMNGDPFIYYRDIDVPLADVIFAYPLGRDGFKLISDGADFYDKPVVAAETFNSFSPAGHKAGYRRLMELYVRGINRLMGSGLPKENIFGDQQTFAQWVGRNSTMLQGGRRVSEVAIFYPIADLEAFYRFDAPEYTSQMRWGTFIPDYSDFMAVGEMLLGEVHRDFTFLHPDFLLSDKIEINGTELKLKNEVNNQNYKVLILPGQRVISLEALRKIKEYYDNGGAVVATSLLPSKSSEFTGSHTDAVANDRQVCQIIKSIFGVDPLQKISQERVSELNVNKKGGKAIFIGKPDAKLLSQTFDKLNISADVVFEGNPSPTSGGGMFSVLHKNRDGRDIYYFANSSDELVETSVSVRGRIVPELWNPADGEMSKIDGVKYVKIGGEMYTKFPFKLDAVSSVFVVSTDKMLH